MRWTVGVLGTIGVVCSMSVAASAQDRPLRRYKPAIISYDLKGADDPGLVALLDQLRAAVTAKNVAVIRDAAAADLAIITPPIGFPPAGAPKPLKLEPAIAGPERLDKAVGLLATGDAEPNRKMLDGLILMTVSDALGKGSVSRSRQVPGAFCAPAEPRFDRGQVLAIAEAADEVPDNLVFLAEETPFLDQPDRAAATAATLKQGTVVPFIEGAVEGKDGQRDWYAVALPNGKRGFAKGDRTLSFEATRLCFAKSGKGEEAKWSLSAVVVPTLTTITTR
jgi:hypothetical protein